MDSIARYYDITSKAIGLVVRVLSRERIARRPSKANSSKRSSFVQDYFVEDCAGESREPKEVIQDCEDRERVSVDEEKKPGNRECALS